MQSVFTKLDDGEFLFVASRDGLEKAPSNSPRTSMRAGLMNT
jgi:hypothetical protein